MGKRVLLGFIAFFLFLFPLYAASDLQQLYEAGEYRKVIYEGRSLPIDQDRLLWESASYEALGEHRAAYETALLGFVWDLEASPERTRLGRLAMINGFAAGDPQGVLGLMAEVDLDQESAEACYQAALQLGKTETARKLFDTWLRSTVSDYEYALMLVGGGVSVSDVLDASHGLSPKEKLAVYQAVARRTLPAGDLSLLMQAAELLEGEDVERKGLYTLLADLAERMNQRVLARRYRTQAGG